MTKKIAAIVTDLVEDVELSSPKEALEKDGNEVTIISFEANQEITGKKGTKFKSDKGIDEVKPDQLRSDARFVSFVSYFLDKDQPLFAICHGPQLFIQTGLTKGRTMTAYTTVRPDVGYAGAIVKDEAVVVDNKLVTSRTPDDLPDFNQKIVEILHG